MSERWCERCGSRSHRAYDCSKADTYSPTAADLAYEASFTAPTAPEPVKDVRDPVAKVQGPVFEAGERFPGCPPICTATNLPAHASKEVANVFHTVNGPSCKVVKLWKCDACGLWHMDTQAPAPAGGSSGNERTSWSVLGALCGLRKQPLVTFRRKIRESAFAGQDNLPQQARRKQDV